MYDTIIKKTREYLTQNPNIVVTLETGWGQRGLEVVSKGEGGPG